MTCIFSAGKKETLAVVYRSLNNKLFTFFSFLRPLYDTGSIPNINLFFKDFPGLERIFMPIQTLDNKIHKYGNVITTYIFGIFV